MNITVYLRANEEMTHAYEKQLRNGAWIGNSGNALVYGGSKVV